MNIDQSFPSKYLKAADLNGRQVQVQISGCQIETLGDGADAQTKPVLYFSGKQKGLVLNRTNATAISEIFGPETDSWLGATITLFPMKVLFQGKMVDSIRVSIPPVPAVQPQQPPPPRQPAPQPTGFTDLNPPPVDDTPF